MLMAGNVFAEDVLTDIAMLSPNDALVPVLARSGEMAPFQTKSELLVADPDCKRVPAAGAISYQRSSVPAPPKTAWAVQRAIWPPWPGSVAATAASKRPSSVSSRYGLPCSGAFAGIA
jgi:hypothetical protein